MRYSDESGIFKPLLVHTFIFGKEKNKNITAVTTNSTDYVEIIIITTFIRDDATYSC